MKTILVPVDFSKNAKNALKFAVVLSQKIQAHLILFNSFHTFHTNAYGSAKAIEHDASVAKRYADRKLKEAYVKTKLSAYTEPEYISSQDELRDAILHLVKTRHIDLIVMGTQGSGNRLEGQLFGTNASWVVEKAPCPVITIPDNLRLKTLTNIVYASDYMSGDIANLKTVSEVAQAFDATISVIHISKDESATAVKALDQFEQQVKAETGLASLRFTLLKGSSVEQRLEQYLHENKVNLLVMSAHQRSLTEKLFGKSITKVMTLYAHTSLMIFHQQAS